MHKRADKRTGLSLVEVMVSTVLIGVCLAAALRALGMTMFTQNGMADDSVAACLADGLLYEVCQMRYDDPTDIAAIQVDADETPLQKTTFDDVDDFHGWRESPPQDSAGQPIAGLDDWTRSVRVEFVEAGDPNRVSSTDQGVKRITVEASKKDRVRAARSALRARYDS